MPFQSRVVWKDPVLPPGRFVEASGGVVTDDSRGRLVDGDGLHGDSSFGIWAATTNLDTLGGAEDGSTTGWTGSLTVTNDTAQRLFGTRAWKLASTGVSQTADKTVTGLTALTAYVRSMWVYRNETAATITVVVRNRLDTADLASVTLAATTGWQRVILPFGTEASHTTVVTRVTISADATQIWVDGAQIQTGTIATPYVETNGATASRVGGYVTSDSTVLNSTQGWVAARYRPGWASTDDVFPGANVHVWSWFEVGSGSHGGLRVTYDPGTDQWQMRRSGNGAVGGATVNAATVAFAAGDVLTLIGAWDANTISISVNGSAFVSTAETIIPVGLPPMWVIGDKQDTLNRQADGDFLWVMAGSGTLTDADAATIHGYGNTDPTETPGTGTFVWPAVTEEWFVPAEPAAPAGTTYQKTGVTAVGLIETGADADLINRSGVTDLTVLPTAVDADLVNRSGVTAVGLIPTAADADLVNRSGVTDLSVIPAGADACIFVETGTLAVGLRPSAVDADLVNRSGVTDVTFAGTGQSGKIVGRAGTLIVGLVPAAQDADLLNRTGVTAVTFQGSAGRVKEHASSGLTDVVFRPSAVDADLVNRSGVTDVAFTPAAADADLLNRAGTSDVNFTATGADASTFVETGNADINVVVSGAAAKVVNKTGFTAVSFRESAVDADLVNRSGLTDVTFLPAAADADLVNRSGLDVTGLVVLGADAAFFAETGKDVVALYLSGASQKTTGSQTYQKTGFTNVNFADTGARQSTRQTTGLTEVSLFVTGVDADVINKTGVTAVTFLASGARVRERPRSGLTAVNTIVKGADAALLTRAGATVIRLDESGSDASLFVESGVQTIQLVGTGASQKILSGAPPPFTPRTYAPGASGRSGALEDGAGTSADGLTNRTDSTESSGRTLTTVGSGRTGV